MEYKVINVEASASFSGAIKKVQEEVNKHLKDGWELAGDLVIVSHHGSNYFVVAQPMVKKN